MQYIIAIHLSNKFFIYLLTAQAIFLLYESRTVQHFVLNQYAEIVFQDIIPNISAAKALIARKSQFKAL